MTTPDYPQVFVAGNQPAAEWRRASLKPWGVVATADNSQGDGEGALLVSVPRFDLTQTVVLMEIDSLRCLPLRFDLSQLSE